MTLTIPDAVWARITAAFAAVQGPLPVMTPAVLNPDGTIKTPAVLMTADAFARQQILLYIKNVTKNNEAGIALQPTPTQVLAAQTNVDSTFPATL